MQQKSNSIKGLNVNGFELFREITAYTVFPPLTPCETNKVKV